MLSRSVTKMHIRWRRLIARTVGATLLGVAMLSAVGQKLEELDSTTPATIPDTIKDQYKRPKAIPFPSNNPYSEAKRLLENHVDGTVERKRSVPIRSLIRIDERKRRISPDEYAPLSCL
jgi:hypothetical protein